MTAIDKDLDFPMTNYNLEVDPSAYFTIVFTDLDIRKVENPILLNYTFFGDYNYEANGTWADMKLTFNKNGDIAGYGDYNITLRVFVAYATPPESGLDGTLGLAVTSKKEYCLMCKLNETYGVPYYIHEWSFK